MGASAWQSGQDLWSVLYLPFIDLLRKVDCVDVLLRLQLTCYAVCESILIIIVLSLPSATTDNQLWGLDTSGHIIRHSIVNTTDYDDSHLPVAPRLSESSETSDWEVV